MQKTFLATLMLGASLQAVDANPLWLRHQTISPDGEKIAFCYQGDIYTVPTRGGVATRLTSHAAYDSAPIWSPDGTQIAFSSDREGSDDLYIMPSRGGAAKRLTVGSEQERPVGFLDNGTVLFQTYLMPSAEFDLFPNALFVQTYAMKTTGSRPKLWSALPMDGISISSEGDVLYTDIKGYEDPWRKHHTSSVTRDIWLRSAGKYTKLTSFAGEDRNAVWDGKGGFYYLSEQDGTFNVYHRANTKSTESTQLTHYKGNPVRFLSRATNGTLCFGYDGEIYTMRPGGAPERVAVEVIVDETEPKQILRKLSNGISSFAVSPSGKEVAFVVRGDVYVTNVEFGTTKRITDTAEQERSVDFAPDGRSLVYASERGGQWQIYQSELARTLDSTFVYAKEIREHRLTSSDKPSFQPRFSPDGKEVAFLRDRTAVMVLNLKSGAERVVVPKHINYSYQDGDQNFAWSPNGEYIITDYMGDGGWNHVDCAVYRADGSGLAVNLTESAYNESGAKWVLGGKAILFASDRAGYRSHGSWGATQDLYLMFLEHKAYEQFRMSKEDRARTPKEAKAQPLKLNPVDLAQRERRIIRLTRASGNIIDAAMNKEGTKVYYIARFEHSTDLWEYDVLERSTKVLVPNTKAYSLQMTAKGDTLFVAGEDGIKKLDGTTLKDVKFTAEHYERPAEERAHIFEHAWQQVADKFYDTSLHGVDWAYYKGVYAKFLPHINNNRDFAEMMSELLGELNASHTGARYQRKSTAPQTGCLGIFADPSYEGDGIKILEVIQGGPLDLSESRVTAGMIIESIDGKRLEASRPLAYYLQNKADKPTLLMLRKDGAKPIEIEVRPTTFASERELLYERWLRRRAELVDKWSQGRIGYVYVRSMNSPSFRTVFKDLLGKYRTREAVIVDTRYNGGGWLHEDLGILLSGRKYMTFSPRGQYIGDDPFMQWNKPSCVLVSEGNYSNGHGFPWMYKQMKIGKVIGSPVAGTMTAVWWERVFNGSIIFGIPQVTCSDLQGRPLENMQLEPDILVYNTPEDYLSGEDRQLRTAVEEMLRQIDRK